MIEIDRGPLQGVRLELVDGHVSLWERLMRFFGRRPRWRTVRPGHPTNN